MARIYPFPASTSVASLRGLRNDAATAGRIDDARAWDEQMCDAERRGLRLDAQRRERAAAVLRMAGRTVTERDGAA